MAGKLARLFVLDVPDVGYHVFQWIDTRAKENDTGEPSLNSAHHLAMPQKHIGARNPLGRRPVPVPDPTCFTSPWGSSVPSLQESITATPAPDLFLRKVHHLIITPTVRVLPCIVDGFDPRSLGADPPHRQENTLCFPH